MTNIIALLLDAQKKECDTDEHTSQSQQNSQQPKPDILNHSRSVNVSNHLELELFYYWTIINFVIAQVSEFAFNREGFKK